MELVGQHLDHLLARFLSCLTSPLLNLAGLFDLWQPHSLQEQLLHLLKCILHFCASRFGIQLLSEFPEALAVPLVGRLDQAKKTHLVLDRAMIETAHHHVWLALLNFGIELEEVINPPSHFNNVKGGIGKLRLTMRSARCAQFSLSRLQKDFSELILCRLVNLWSKELLPLALLFVSEGTCWRPPPVGIIGTQLAVPANPAPVQLKPANWRRRFRIFDLPECLFR